MHPLALLKMSVCKVWQKKKQTDSVLTYCICLWYA